MAYSSLQQSLKCSLKHGGLSTRPLRPLPAVKWQSRECCQDSEEAIFQVYGGWKVGVPGVTRLAQHTICWNGYQSTPAPHWPEVQDISSNCWLTTTAEESTLHGESCEPSDAPPGEPRSKSTGPIILRRSARESRAPEWHKDYHIPVTA